MSSSSSSESPHSSSGWYSQDGQPNGGRLRRKHSKVKSGCSRCRQRKIKCDESKPECMRCRKLGQPCPGYQEVQPKLFGLGLAEGFSSEDEKKYFTDFFVPEGGAQQLGLFVPSSRNFFVSLLPQLSQLYLPIRHGTIALSIVSKPFFQPEVGALVIDEKPEILNSVLFHWNKSIHAFLAESPNLSMTAKLSLCYVFCALSMFTSRVAAATEHGKGAYDIIQAYTKGIREGEIVADPAIEYTMRPLMKRVFIDACTFSDSLLRFSAEENPYEMWKDELLRLPDSSSDVESMYEYVGLLLKYAIASASEYLDQESDTAQHMREQMEAFSLNLPKYDLNIYLDTKLSQERTTFHRLDIEIHICTARIIASCHGLEDSFWIFTSEFRFIVQQLAVLMTIEPTDPNRVSLGWIPPLFLVACKCRVPNVRREALRMLHSLHRVEKGWTSCIAYTIAKFVIEQEDVEQSARSGPASAAYIRLLGIELQPEKDLATISYEVQVDRASIAAKAVTIGLRSEADAAKGIPVPKLTNAVLRASGYSSTALFCPSIPCHCLDTSTNILGENTRV